MFDLLIYNQTVLIKANEIKGKKFTIKNLHVRFVKHFDGIIFDNLNCC